MRRGKVQGSHNQGLGVMKTFRIPDSKKRGSGVRDQGLGKRHSEFRIRDLKFETWDSGFRILKSGDEGAGGGPPLGCSGSKTSLDAGSIASLPECALPGLGLLQASLRALYQAGGGVGGGFVVAATCSGADQSGEVDAGSLARGAVVVRNDPAGSAVG